MTQGNRLALIIKENSLSQSAFAEKFNINRQHISQLVNDKKPIGRQLLERITRECRINAHWLLTGEGEMYVKPSQPETPPEMDSRITELEHQIFKMQKEIEDLRYVSNLQARLIWSYELQLGVNNDVEMEGQKGKFPAVSLSVENGKRSLTIRHKKGNKGEDALKACKHSTYFIPSLSMDKKKREINLRFPNYPILYPFSRLL